jgi:hypothetical protein
VNDLLDTEEDMVDLYLTSKILTGHRRQTHEHVEAELLLEMYAPSSFPQHVFVTL